MDMKNSVFIATSLDGYISDINGKIDWLHSFPNPENDDMGYTQFMNSIDALVMGRTTFEIVCGFDIDWPYKKPVFVLSNTLTEIPEKAKGNVFIMSGSLTEVLKNIHQKGFENLYIDGGKTIQGFLKEGLIDEMIITIIPTLLGGGTKLFDELPYPIAFQCFDTKHFLGKVAQNHFKRSK